MMRWLALALLLASCVAPESPRCRTAADEQATGALALTTSAVMIGAGVAVDPTAVRDSKTARSRRVVIVLSLSGAALFGAMLANDAEQRRGECVEAPRAPEGSK